MRILALNGSLRRDSHNLCLLESAAHVLPPTVELERWTELKTIPPFDEDDEHVTPLAVARLRAAVHGADGLLIATPEYNSSLPGQLKNALDWLSRPYETNALRGKPVAVVGASTGLFGAVWAQADARRVLSTIGARVLDRELPVPRAHVQFTDAGHLHDEELREQYADVLAALVEEARGARAA